MSKLEEQMSRFSMTRNRGISFLASGLRLFNKHLLSIFPESHAELREGGTLCAGKIPR